MAQDDDRDDRRRESAAKRGERPRKPDQSAAYRGTSTGRRPSGEASGRGRPNQSPSEQSASRSSRRPQDTGGSRDGRPSRPQGAGQSGYQRPTDGAARRAPASRDARSGGAGRGRPDSRDGGPRPARGAGGSDSRGSDDRNRGTYGRPDAGGRTNRYPSPDSPGSSAATHRRPSRDPRPEPSGDRDKRDARSGSAWKSRGSNPGGSQRSDRPRGDVASAPGARPSRAGSTGRSASGSRDARPARDNQSSGHSRPSRDDSRNRSPRPSNSRDDAPLTRAQIARRSLPVVPAEADGALLDPAIRADLRGLAPDTADAVAKQLVAAGLLVDEDPLQALVHARAARSIAARIAAVREAVGVAAYHAQEWTEALAELRAARRISGDPRWIAVMADCERALGRPERALKALDDPDFPRLEPAARLEVLIVVAGARRDLGQGDAALQVLAKGGLDPARPVAGSSRLWYTYADTLTELGRNDEARRWFEVVSELDEDETDASDRMDLLDAAARQ